MVYSSCKMINKKDKIFWKNKKVFLTGHTGFKGSWLCIMLNTLGANIYGYSLKPKKKSLYNLAGIEKIVKKSFFNNINDKNKIKRAISQVNPDIIFHLAAQPLVLESYKDPINTYETNIIGTVNILESVREIKNSKVKSFLVITTDKVYDTKFKKKYKEDDKLGSGDPYSTSKSCCELICESYRKSFPKIKNILSTVRAGNVIGGGDYAENRLVPDILKATIKNGDVILRNPDHIRPWQHVFEPLYGYLVLSKKIYNLNLPDEFANWNFGPNMDSCKSVFFVASEFKKKLPINLKIINNKKKLKENSFLILNNKKSKTLLKWKPKWSLKYSINKIIEWNVKIKKNDVFKISKNQVKEYLNLRK